MHHSPNASGRARLGSTLRTLRLRPRLRWALLALSVACGADDAPSEPDPNPSLEHWCGAKPCGWELNRGEVARVPSWHDHDYAVELSGPDETRLSQLRNSTVAQCLTFDMVARVAKDARLTLHLDFNDDGLFDWSQSVSEMAWKSVRFSIPTPTAYARVRFIVMKEGPGAAVLAQIVIAGEDECPTFPLLLEAGSRCEDDSVCQDGLACVSSTCRSTEAVGLPMGSE